MAKVTLAGARVSAGLTQKEMAEKLEVSRKSVNDWESGKTQIRAVNLYAICKLTGFEPDDIILP